MCGASFEHEQLHLFQAIVTIHTFAFAFGHRNCSPIGNFSPPSPISASMTIPRRVTCPFLCRPRSSLFSSRFRTRFAGSSVTAVNPAKALISLPVSATTSKTRHCKTRSFSSVTTAAAAASPSNIAASTLGRCARKISSVSRSSLRTSGRSGTSVIRREYSEHERRRSRVRLYRGDRETLSKTKTFSRRAHQAHARPHRATRSCAQRVYLRHHRTRPRSSKESRNRVLRSARPHGSSRPRPAPWHSHFVEGQHQHGWHPHARRLENSAQLHSTA